MENELCFDTNANTLNAACSTNFTSTCIDRRDELLDSTMEKYCAANPTADVCSCYTDPPAFIQKTISGLAKCWNKKCAERGYIPKSMHKYNYMYARYENFRRQ